MDKKAIIRKRYFLKRKKNYFIISKKFFLPFIKLIKKIKSKRNIISLYYPSSYEIDILKIIDIEYFKKYIFLLPVIEKNNAMNFYSWKKTDVMSVNKYGILEPMKIKKMLPNIILVPLLAFDKNKNRLGYGKGFYDKFLKKYIKLRKNTITIGVAFSFQKHHNLPINKNDYKLNYVLTEKGII